MLGQFEVDGAPFDSAEFASIVKNTTIIPDAVKRMVVERLDDICVAIQEASPFDPIVKAIAELDAVVMFAHQALSDSATKVSASRSP